MLKNKDVKKKTNVGEKKEKWCLKKDLVWWIGEVSRAKRQLDKKDSPPPPDTDTPTPYTLGQLNKLELLLL